MHRSHGRRTIGTSARLLLAAGWALTLGCRATTTPAPPTAAVQAPPQPTAEPAPAPRPRIALERLDAGRWRVTYHLAQPARTLRFWRAAQWFREPTWTVKTPGYRLARDGDSQVITLDADATASDVITVEFTEHPEAMIREYRPAQRFSDGAVALFTGHLYVRDVADEARQADAPYLATLQIITPPEATTLVLGEVHEGGTTTTWADPHHEGTYVYFGAPGTAHAPVVTEHVTLVLDPGLSAELRERLVELFGSMLDALATGHRVPLPWRPLVLVAWQAGQGGSRRWEGGTRPGLIHMTLEGGWNPNEPETLRHLAHFVGHEAAHFWNGTLVHNQDDPWLHEGAAEAVADALMVRLDLMDRATHQQERERAINRCLDTLEGTGLGNIDQGHGHRVHYTCGYTMATWSEAAVASSDLLDIWAALIERVGPGGAYDRRAYFAVLRELGADPSLVDRMEAFVTQDSSTQARDLIEGFGRVGLPLKVMKRPPPAERPRLAGKAVTHLQATACGGRSLSTFGDHLRTYPIEGCPAFAVEADIHAVAGTSVTEGDRAYDRVRRRCRAGRTIRLTDRAGTTVLEVACTEPLAPRTPWLSLVR